MQGTVRQPFAVFLMLALNQCMGCLCLMDLLGLGIEGFQSPALIQSCFTELFIFCKCWERLIHASKERL